VGDSITDPGVTGIEERFITAQADDGLALSGIRIVPMTGPPSACVVWVHGFGVTYDLPQCVRFGRELAGRDIAFVAGNLRGHAGGVTGWRRRGDSVEHVRIGSWWEVFEESALDIAAWIDAGESIGTPALVLAGHSFGALRSVYYLSASRDRRIDGLVLASPSFGLRKLDQATAAESARLVAAGRGEDLLPDGSWPGGFGTRTVSAQTYASWWRVAPALLDPAAGRFADVLCPMLVWYGATQDVGGQSELDLIAQLAGSSARMEQRILPGVTHGYAGAEATMADAISDWIPSLTTAALEAVHPHQPTKEQLP
jgi:dienelactone hydrolase